MTTQTWLDRHNQAYAHPLDPHEKVLVAFMRHTDLLIVNSVTAEAVEPVRAATIKILSGFIALIHALPTTGRLDKGTLEDWARSRAHLVGITDDDDL